MAKTHLSIRLMHQDQIAMGPGKADLLEAIAQYGSISAAAKSMGMSYKRAWDLVTVMNQTFKEPIVATAVGGQHGGGTTLTPLGEQVLSLYRDMQRQTEQFVASAIQPLQALLSQDELRRTN